MAGRPPIQVSDKDCRTIAKLAGYGMTEASIAHILGMHPNTFARKKQDDERIVVALEKGKSDAEQRVGKALYTKAINGDLGAIVWWEKTRADRYERQRQEHTGKDGGPIETKAAADPVDYIAGELARLAAAGGTPTHSGNGRRNGSGR
jgi:hypothetical protein